MTSLLLLVKFYKPQALTILKKTTRDGTNEANCKKEYWWYSSPKSTGNEGSKKERSLNWWCEKTSPIQTRNSRFARNPTISEVNWVADQKVAFPASCPWNRSGLQDWSAVPEHSNHGPAGSQWELLGHLVRRHQLVRDPCQASYNHA